MANAERSVRRVNTVDEGLVEFRETYEELSQMGLCDGVEGAEYQRVRAEWEEKGRPSKIAMFIVMRANDFQEW